MGYFGARPHPHRASQLCKTLAFTGTLTLCQNPEDGHGGWVVPPSLCHSSQCDRGKKSSFSYFSLLIGYFNGIF